MPAAPAARRRRGRRTTPWRQPHASRPPARVPPARGRRGPSCGPRRPCGRGTHPVADGGAVRGVALGQEQSEDVLDLVEAQPQGVQSNAGPPLLVAAPLDTVVPPSFLAQLPLEILDLAAKIPALTEQLVAAGAGLLGRGDGLLNPVGVFAGGLAAAAGLLRLRRDVAVLAEQDGGGVADPGKNG